MKKKIPKITVRRVLALFLSIVMCVSLLNLDLQANELLEHTHNEGGWSCRQEEPARMLICERAEHSHGEACYAPGEDVVACERTEHTHGEDCIIPGENGGICPLEEHIHGEECITHGEEEMICLMEKHIHGEACYIVTEGRWICTPPSSGGVLLRSSPRKSGRS